MPKLANRTPKYRRHKVTGRAVVTLDGRDYYLGKWNTAASRRAYDRLTSQWLSAGRVLVSMPSDILTVTEMLAAFWRHAKTYYVDPDGGASQERINFGTLIKRLRRAYGETLAKEFGPLKLKAFRQTLIDKGLARSNVNRQITRVRHIFKWAAGNELVPVEVVEALRCVAGLRYGKSQAKETEPIQPVPDAFVDAVLPFVAPQVAAMIELQRVTGMRSGEVCQLRACDINTSGSVWIYKPARHKGQFRGHARAVYFGPRAQAIVRPWLKRNLQAYLFSPAEADQWRREQRHKARKTPVNYGNRPGTNRVRQPARKAGECYTTSSYLRAVMYAIERCNAAQRERNETEIPHWHPHQLRHNAGTHFRREFGLEVARVLLGHKHAAVTEIYAEADQKRAIEVMAAIG